MHAPQSDRPDQQLAILEHSRAALADRLHVPCWHIALQALALAILFLLPGLSRRPGHEFQGADLAVPIVLAVSLLTLLEDQLFGRQGVRLRRDRVNAYPSTRRPLVISIAVVLIGSLLTWIVALQLSWIAALAVGAASAGLVVWTSQSVTGAAVSDIRAGRTRPR
jgi:hypothetical protein